MKHAVPLLAALLLSSSFASGTPAGTGYSYHHDSISEVPWSIHILKVERAHAGLQLHTVLAGGNTFGLNSLPGQVELLPESLGRAIAAINGDFYNNHSHYKGDPKGLQIMRGELVSAPNEWTCMWVGADRQLHMGKVESKFSVTWPDGSTNRLGLNERRLPSAAVLYTSVVGASTRASGGREFVLEPLSTTLPLQIGREYSFRVKEITRGNARITSQNPVLSVGQSLVRSLRPIAPGAILKISTETAPSLAGTVTAISGGPALVHNGKLVYNSSQQRHPRAAIGWNDSHFFFVEVDGRQPAISLGMSYNELAEYLIKLGCSHAMNLDGGASATLWVLGQTMNSPSSGRERSIANALVLMQMPQGAASSTAGEGAGK